MDSVKMRGGRDAAPTLAWRGEQYKADKQGLFTVPKEAVPELIRHGFTVAHETLHLKKDSPK